MRPLVTNTWMSIDRSKIRCAGTRARLVSEWHNLVCPYVVPCWAGIDTIGRARKREHGRGREREGEEGPLEGPVPI